MEISWLDHELLEIISLCLLQLISGHHKPPIKISSICFIFCQVTVNTGIDKPADILIFWTGFDYIL